LNEKQARRQAKLVSFKPIRLAQRALQAFTDRIVTTRLMRAPEEENRELERMYAELLLDHRAPKDGLEKGLGSR